MEFSLDSSSSHYIIRSCEPGKIMVNEETFTQNFIIMPQAIICPWDEQDFDVLVKANPQIVLLGTGVDFIIIPPHKLAVFYHNNIGLEIMNTASACRTFNVLASEGRNVVAGLIV